MIDHRAITGGVYAARDEKEVSVHRAPHLGCCRALEVQKVVCATDASHLRHPVNVYNALGGVLKSSDQLVFRQAIKMGVTYWDTADSYAWGNNEKAIVKYFDKFQSDRAKVFLVTKASSSDAQKLTEKLNSSLQRMNTSYVDTSRV